MLPVLLLVEILAILDISLVISAREVAEHLHEERCFHFVILINILGFTNVYEDYQELDPGCYLNVGYNEHREDPLFLKKIQYMVVRISV